MAIWNLGSINIDHVYRLPHLPKAGETIAATELSQGLGGKGANQSIAAARAGAKTWHLGAMSTADQWVIQQLTDSGVIIDHIQRLTDTATGHAIILLDAQAENSIIIYPGANRAQDQLRLLAAAEQLDARDTLLIQNETNCQVEIAKAAKSKGVRVIYSAAPFDIDAVRAVMPHTSILAMNAGEAEALFATLQDDLPVEALLITRGSEGAEYRDLRSGEISRQAAFRVQPIDTTGAGDTFAGYFAAMLDQGADIPAALRMAAAASALQVTRMGAGDAIPTIDEVNAFLAGQPKA